jgi:competence protein ComEC
MKQRLFGIKGSIGLVLVLLSITVVTWIYYNPGFEWVSINVNSHLQQGDAHLLRFGKYYVLLDTGNASIVGSPGNLIDFLRRRNIRVLDALVISHIHNDHYGGLNAILDEGIKIGTVYANIDDEDLAGLEPWGLNWDDVLKLRERLKQMTIPVKRIEPGMRLDYGKGLLLEVLYCFRYGTGPQGPIRDLNDTSAIIRVTHGRLRYLFTGDLNSSLGGWLARNAADELQAHILKAPHHGTEGLAPNEFFMAVHPDVVIIPSPLPLWGSERSKRLRELVSKQKWSVYVNGSMGHIMVRSYFGKFYRISTFR